MNKRFLSTLLFGALFIASTSVFVSCKDYDDDIKNLQTQIDKAALKSQLDALQTTLDNAKANAESSMKNLEAKLNAQAEANAANADELQKQIDAVKAAADAAAKDLAAKIEAAAKAAADAQAAADKAQQSADQAAKEAAELAKAAQEAAELAVKEAVAKLNEQNAELQKQIENLGRQMTEYVKADELAKQIEALKQEIYNRDAADGTDASVAAYKAMIDELYSAITGIELIDSFTGIFYPGGYYLYYSQGNGLTQTWYNTDEDWYKEWDPESQMNWWGLDHWYNDEKRWENIEINLTHGLVPWDSEFGNNELNYKDIDGVPENVEPFVKYTKNADIKNPVYGLIVRANPINADLTTADIRLINSLGQDLSDYVKVGTPERFHALYATTRSDYKNRGNGLWILPLEVQNGMEMTEEKFKEFTTFYGYLAGDPTLGTNKILYAVAVNNTKESDAGADRYVISSYDIAFDYTKYVPANHFTFNVYNELNPTNPTSVNDIHNRYAGYGYVHPIYGEIGMNQDSGDTWELEWLPDNQPNYPAPTPEVIKNAGGQNFQNCVNLWNGVGCRMEDQRWWSPLLAVGLNETFTIADFEAYDEWGNFVAVDSMYVVLDKHNAVESEPSEINAWEGYQRNNGIEGLNQHVTAAKGISLKVTDPRANGDVIGFRVFAVNRDGSLVDPDGRAFYILVTDKASHETLSSTVTATVEGKTDTSTEMASEKLWNDNLHYVLEVADNTAKCVDKTGNLVNARLDFFQFNFDKNVVLNFEDQYVSSTYISAGVLKGNFKNLTITPTNIENLIDGATYTFYLTAYETVAGTDVPRRITTITLTKLMPTKAKELTFRPKQETVDGSGDVIAYMIPNKEYTVANPYAPFADFNFAPHQTTAEIEACYDARDAKANNGFKNLSNIFYNLSKNGQNGYDSGSYDPTEWDTTYEFIFGTSNNDGTKDLIDPANNKGVSFEHPQGDQNWQKYMLEVPVKLIDGTTKHAVKSHTIYSGISTYVDKNQVVHYNEDYAVENGQDFTFTYACWHHANTYAWVNDNKKPKLQWTHTAEGTTTPFADIASKNSYDPQFFGDGLVNGVTLQKLATKFFLVNWDNVVLNTLKLDDPDFKAKNQINPYFVPSINAAATTITYTQKSTQNDAAPVADHTEYLVITAKDAFNHDVIIELDVVVKRP